MTRNTRAVRRTVGRLSLLSPHFGRWLDCPVPLISENHRFELEATTETLFVLLPGIQDQHVDFEIAGFVSAVKQMNLKADLLAVDAHVGYYVRKTLVDRLRDDIILPARQMGYKNIWLVGTSLGGLGSALYAQKYETDINGVLLLAPYLGEPSMIREISRAGGPGVWLPKKVDFKFELWAWLKKYYDDPNRRPHLFLGFGEKDKFAYANRFLAEALPRERVLMTAGAHDWATWHRLWLKFLEQFKEIKPLLL